MYSAKIISDMKYDDMIKYFNEQYENLLDKYFHIECGPGWKYIIFCTLNQLGYYNHNEDDEFEEASTFSATQSLGNVKVTYIKEKFGELRIGIDNYNKVTRSIVNLASNLSLYTCEETGDVGVMHVKEGWYKVLSYDAGKKLGFTPVKRKLEK